MLASPRRAATRAISPGRCGSLTWTTSVSVCVNRSLSSTDLAVVGLSTMNRVTLFPPIGKDCPVKVTGRLRPDKLLARCLRLRASAQHRPDGTTRRYAPGQRQGCIIYFAYLARKARTECRTRGSPATKQTESDLSNLAGRYVVTLRYR